MVLKSSALLRFKKFSGKFDQIFVQIFLPKIESIVNVTRGDFWKGKGNGKMVEFTAKFFETE